MGQMLFGRSEDDKISLTNIKGKSTDVQTRGKKFYFLVYNYLQAFLDYHTQMLVIIGKQK